MSNLSEFHSVSIVTFYIKQISQWCKEADSDVTMKFRLKFPKAPVTVTDASNPYWSAFKQATDEL